MPEALIDVVEPTYNDNKLFLSRLEVQWRVQASGSVYTMNVHYSSGHVAASLHGIGAAK